VSKQLGRPSTSSASWLDGESAGVRRVALEAHIGRLVKSLNLNAGRRENQCFRRKSSAEDALTTVEAFRLIMSAGESGQQAIPENSIMSSYPVRPQPNEVKNISAEDDCMGLSLSRSLTLTHIYHFLHQVFVVTACKSHPRAIARLLSAVNNEHLMEKVIYVCESERA